MRHVLYIILLILLTNVCFAQKGREKISFNEDWKFHYGNAADPQKDFNYGIANLYAKTGKAEGTPADRKFNDADWRGLQLPHDWAAELPFVNHKNTDVKDHGYKPVGGLFPETSIGWYRKSFTVSKADSGRRIAIQFDGIFRNAKIWVNGFYIGTNESGYVGLTKDITDYIDFQKSNLITVRVDATQYEGWFYEGAGIYRNAWLLKYDNVHFANDGVFVYNQVVQNKATVFVESELTNNGSAPKAVAVDFSVTDRNGKLISQVAGKTINVNPGTIQTVKQFVVLSQPDLWSLENPYLYRVTARIRSGSQVLDQQVIRTGIRTVLIKNDGVYLNGKHIKIKGTNNHQDHAGIGSALPDYLHYYRIRLLREMGSNAYRTSHHAPAPELLDACDSVGMLVLDEQRLLSSSTEYVDQFERLLRRDRNHPSVFLWSIGNEEGYAQANSFGKRIAQTLLAKQKQLDPTRTSTYAADMANVYTGVNEVIPVRGFNYRQFAVADYHRDHPMQPIIGTEMGSTVTTRGIYQKDTVRAYLPDQDMTAPWWASKAEEWWPLAAENNYWLGGFIWTGFDYRGEPTPFARPNISSHFGVMDVCGFPKNIYYYYKSWWSDEDVIHISPHWNWKEGQTINVWVNSNAQSVELFLNGKSLGKKTMPVNRHLEWNVPYVPGTLEAVGERNNRVIRAKVETTGEPDEVVLSPSKTTMLANGQDATVINISAFDKHGREVPDAANKIKFSIAGNARIIGVGNGDPSSHEPDQYKDSLWERSLFNGKAQLIIQAGKQPGIIKIDAKSNGLHTGSTTIVSIDPPAKHSPSVKTATAAATALPKKTIEKIIGADISFLPQLEARGIKFKDKGVEKDAIQILKAHGFNYIRLRIFNQPANEKGYSPQKGFCDLNNTLAMAKRIKKAGMKFLLDFHYSDYWADPQQQNKPKAWEGKSFSIVKDSLYQYTKMVLTALKRQNTLPDMVQIGNEINHGIVWPDAEVNNMDQLAALLKAGLQATTDTDPRIVTMIHIALGGQNDESRFFLDEMLSRGVSFDVIGQSYYPKWHSTLSDLQNNLSDLATHYQKDVILVEYSQKKEEVHDIIFNLPQNRGKGTFIWEPLNTWEAVFEPDGQSNKWLDVYDEIAKKYGLTR
jgi:beta-galactosidase